MIKLTNTRETKLHLHLNLLVFRRGVRGPPWLKVVLFFWNSLKAIGRGKPEREKGISQFEGNFPALRAAKNLPNCPQSDPLREFWIQTLPNFREAELSWPLVFP